MHPTLPPEIVYCSLNTDNILSANRDYPAKNVSFDDSIAKQTRSRETFTTSFPYRMTGVHSRADIQGN